MNVNKDEQSRTGKPAGEPTRRPRGRPPVPAEEAEQSPLTVRSTKAMKDALVRAAKASGRSLAKDIKDRLGRTLWEDHDKDDAEIRLDIFAREVKELALALLRVEQAYVLKAETTAVGAAPEVLPVDISVRHSDDGPVVLIDRQDGSLIEEIPLSSGRAQWLAGELLEANEAPVNFSAYRSPDGPVLVVEDQGGDRVIKATLLSPARAQWLGHALLDACREDDAEEPVSIEARRQRKSPRST